MNETIKIKIVKSLNARLAVVQSQRKVAEELGISTAHLNNIANQKLEQVSDAVMRKVAAGLGVKQDEWQLAVTCVYNTLTELLKDAKQFSNVYAMTCPAGSGKTYTSRKLREESAAVHYILCGEYMNKKRFLAELATTMGLKTNGLNVYELLDLIEEGLLKQDRPLIVLDEADKLRDEVLYFFITLYNKLHGKCGIVLLSTDYFAQRIAKGKAKNKKGYQEIESRFGRRIVELPEIGPEDCRSVCVVNGLTDKSVINNIIKNSELDLRRVERLIHAHKNMGGE